jgi:hypothetical protein
VEEMVVEEVEMVEEVEDHLEEEVEEGKILYK